MQIFLSFILDFILDTQRSLSMGKHDSPSTNKILTLAFKTDLPVKLLNCIIFLH